MWRVGGGRHGYEQLGDTRIADDPVLRLFLRNDEVETTSMKGVRDRNGVKIVCDQPESKLLQDQGATQTWTARHIAIQLHTRHHFTHAAATDGSRKEQDGRTHVAYGVYEGVPPAPTPDTDDPEEQEQHQQRRDTGGIYEPRHTIQDRAGQGLWGHRLPDSWEIMDAELYAIYSYLKACADNATTTSTACRCLILSDCKSALVAIERAYRRRNPGASDHRGTLSAILLQLKRLQTHNGYAIFLWTPGHAGISPNAMADAAAKAYLTQPHDPHEMATFITQICEDIAVIHDVHSGDLRDRWIYREVKCLSTHWILHNPPPLQPTTHHPHPHLTTCAAVDTHTNPHNCKCRPHALDDRTQ